MENLKIKNVICREEGRTSLKNLSGLYPHGVNVIEEWNFFEPLPQDAEKYDCLLVVLDENGNIESVFDTKKEALNSWLSLYNQELIESL
jgi:hypothetical protein